MVIAEANKWPLWADVDDITDNCPARAKARYEDIGVLAGQERFPAPPTAEDIKDHTVLKLRLVLV
jgi:hypothetical protein